MKSPQCTRLLAAAGFQVAAVISSLRRAARSGRNEPGTHLGAHRLHGRRPSPDCARSIAPRRQCPWVARSARQRSRPGETNSYIS